MSKSHSIIMITGSYPPRTCGIADYCQRLAQALTAKELSVTVLTSQCDHSEPWPVESVGQEWNLRAIFDVTNRVRQMKPDIVHLQYQAGIYNARSAICVLPLLVRVLTRSKVVVTYHDLNGPPGWGRLHRLGVILTLAASNRAVVCSNKQFTALKRLPFLAHKAVQIPVGPSVIPSIDSITSDQAESSLISIVHFGFVWRNRGLESVVSAAATAAKAGHKIELTFAGGIVDKEHHIELIELAEKLGLSNEQVIFTDALPAPELSKIIQQSSFCILPFPTGVSTGRTTFMSCAVHGLPIITTYDSTNCPEVLRHDDNVLLYNYGDDQQLSELTVRLCTDPALRQKLRNRILETSKRLDWPSIAAEHARIYSQIHPQ